MTAIRRVAVLGAGTMGSRIAAHFANAQIPVLLLDLAAPDAPDRSAAARKGIDAAAKGKPAAFFTDAARALVAPGNFEDHLGELASCDWVIEAVTENLDIKRALWGRVIQQAGPSTLLATNTSGIPLRAIADGWPDDARRRFFGVHFFNPPRYLHLVELIPGPATDRTILDSVAAFVDRRLGKGVVPCKDTPNFIANRIGSFYGATVYQYMMEDDFSVEEIDALTGPLIGLPSTASFRLLDLVGIDIWAFVAGNLYAAVPDDPWRERFLPPPFLNGLMERKWLGDKTGQGFYKRVGKEKEIQALDWKTLEYHPAAKPKFPSIEPARNIEDLGERLRALVRLTDKPGAFLWKLFADVMTYSAERVPEISDRLVEIDRAMRWGYAHRLGPFELWDALGFVETARRMEREGRQLPPTVVRMLESGATSFYRAADENGAPKTEYFCLTGGAYRGLDALPGSLPLAPLKRARGVVEKNAGASLIDLGDGVLGLEFHSKMNSLGEDTIQMIHTGLDRLERNFDAMVVANEGENFSVGANLMLVLMAAQEGEWDDLNLAVHRFQQAHMALKYAPKPVVAAPFSRALGGGCEVVLHCRGVQAAAELYMGLVEVGVGLIPGAGGCKEMIARLKDPRRVFELIGFAKVSTSAEDAKALGLLDRAAGITMNADRLIADAKTLALSLTAGYRPGQPRHDISVSGQAGYAAMKLGGWIARQGGYISDHDQVIAEKLAHVLSGGRLTGAPLVSEQYLLDLEREAFLSLCGMPRTQARMLHMLKTGKPLRN